MVINIIITIIIIIIIIIFIIIIINSLLLLQYQSLLLPLLSFRYCLWITTVNDCENLMHMITKFMNSYECHFIFHIYTWLIFVIICIITFYFRLYISFIILFELLPFNSIFHFFLSFCMRLLVNDCGDRDGYLISTIVYRE